MTARSASDPSASALPPSAQRVQQALDDAGVGARVIELAVAARTAQQAAEALGVCVAQIAKSLVFRAATSGRAVLVVAAGDRRVSETRIAALLDEPIERAQPDFVRAHAGFAIGGVPPLAHAQPMTTFVDDSLWRFDTVWAAGGTPHCVFPIAPDALLHLSGGRRSVTGDDVPPGFTAAR